MGDRDWKHIGQYEPEVSDEDILEAIEEHSPATTAEVQEAVGYARPQSAFHRLKRLEISERVKSKTYNLTLVWMLPDD